MQSRFFHCLIQTIYYLIRQKCCNHFNADRRGHMFFNHLHGIAIQIIFYRRIAHTIKMLILVFRLFTDTLIGFFHRQTIQGVNMILGHFGLRRHLMFHKYGFRFQHTTGCRNADMGQRLSDFIFQLPFYNGNGCCHR